MVVSDALTSDISSELNSGTDAFDFGLDHNEPAPDVRQKETYEDIMGISTENNEGGGNKSLSNRLLRFREWLDKEAEIVIHPSLCLVNGEATDGTKNAPILEYEASTENTTPSDGRIGIIDGESDRALYEQTMGCQVRSTKEIKKDDILLTVPRTAMVTPDVVAASDAGRAVLACCEPSENNGSHFWDSFENTTICEKKYINKVNNDNGTQLLVKILQHRKKAETAATKSQNARDENVLASGKIAGVGKNKISLKYKLAPSGTISTRAPILAFLIHQRFSDSVSPLVVDDSPEIMEEMEDSPNGVTSAQRIKHPAKSPTSFGPYARILPSTIPLPLCWRRNELALLAGCVPGIAALQEVAGMTLQLASEFVTLVDAGILHRFPSVFPRGLITWERWIWAASVFMSRVLPASCYFNQGEDSTVSAKHINPDLFQSKSDVWDELGVMIPFQDMLNHEPDAAQVTWQPASIAVKNESGDESGEEHDPRSICHKRVKKGSELYCNYGLKSNHLLILQYGFGLINNLSDEVKVGWGLGDAVGDIDTPDYFKTPFQDENDNTEEKFSDIVKVYESTEGINVTNWWNKSRLKVLEHEALLPDSILTMLQAGKKMISAAYHDGHYHPGLLSAAVVATMTNDRVESLALRNGEEKNKQEFKLSITKSHQKSLQRYLVFFFTRKMEKMLQSLNNGLNHHFDHVNLWIKMTEGGLSYYSKEEDAKNGWNKFFEEKAYTSSMAVEKNYFTLSPDSCVLALYDGHLRSLQTSIDGLMEQDKFGEVLRQLEDLGYKVLENDDLPPAEVLKPKIAIKDEDVEKETKEAEEKKEAQVKDGEKEPEEKVVDGTNNNGKAKEKGKSKRVNRKPKKKRGNGAISGGVRGDRPNNDRPRALKLHIGNLAYCTLASDLFEYFAATYGRENVLECHIPTEKESGRSRGFGFVTMTHGASLQALQPGRKHDVHGRVLKIAESNSAGSANRNRGPGINAIVASDRCGRCGYRPRYCICAVPDIPAFNGAAGRPPFHDDMRGPEFDPYARPNPEFDHYGGSYRRERAREHFSASPMHHRMMGMSRRDREHYEMYERERDYNRHRHSRSRSYSPRRDRERTRRRSRERERGRHRERDRTRSRDRRRMEDRSRYSRYSRSVSRSVSSERSRSPRSPRRERGRDHDNRNNNEGKVADHGSGARDRERSGSNDLSPGSASPERKRDRDSRKRSRSRSRERRGRRKRSSKKGRKET